MKYLPIEGAEPSNINIVKDWNKVQGYTDATDEHQLIRRNINYRYVSIENATKANIGFSIEKSMTVKSQPRFVLPPKGIKDLAVNEYNNTYDYGIQYIRLFDGDREIGHPCPLTTDANEFVIRESKGHAFVHKYHRPVYRS